MGIISFILSFFVTFYHGFVFQKLYTWFILPVFTNMPELNYIQATGITIVIALLTHQINLSSNSEDETGLIGNLISFLHASVYLFAGFIFSLFM